MKQADRAVDGVSSRAAAEQSSSEADKELVQVGDAKSAPAHKSGDRVGRRCGSGAAATSGKGVAGRCGGGAAVPAREEPDETKTGAHAERAVRASAAQGVPLAPRQQQPRPVAREAAVMTPRAPAMAQPGQSKTAAHAGKAASAAQSQGVSLAPRPRRLRPTARRTAAVAVRAAAVETLPRNLAALPLGPAEQPW